MFKMSRFLLVSIISLFYNTTIGRNKKKTYTILRSVCSLRITWCKYIFIGFRKTYIYVRVHFQYVQKQEDNFSGHFRFTYMLTEMRIKYANGVNRTA